MITETNTEETVTKTIAFDRPKLALLKAAYNAASQKGKSSFEFEGHTLLTNYAKYLIEHIDNTLP